MPRYEPWDTERASTIIAAYKDQDGAALPIFHADLSRRGADEVLCLINAARALVLGDLRVRAERARAIHLTAGGVRGNDLVRSLTRFNPG